MKRRVYFLVIVSLVTGALMLTTGVVRAESVKLLFAGGPPAGGLALRVEAISKAIMKGAPDYRVTTVPGESMGNLKRLGTGEVDIATAWAINAYEAASGEPPYDKPVVVPSIAATVPNLAQFRVLVKAGLTSIRDMIEKKYPLKVNVGTRNSGPELAARRILKAYGVTYKDIESWGGKVYFQSQGVATPLMADGTIEALFFVSGMPDPNIVQLARTTDILLFPIREPEVVKALDSQAMQDAIIPAGIYKFVKEDIPTVETLELLLCRPGLPDEVVYNITKAMAENRDYMSGIYKALRYLTPKTMPSSRKSAPLHPGAERYYREAGWLK